MAFCARCGTQLGESAGFCPICGAAGGAAASPLADPSQAVTPQPGGLAATLNRWQEADSTLRASLVGLAIVFGVAIALVLLAGGGAPSANKSVPFSAVLAGDTSSLTNMANPLAQ